MARKCPDAATLTNRRTLDPFAERESAVVTERLIYECDTTMYLASLVGQVTAGASSDLERGTRWVAYLQRTLGSGRASVDADGTAIYHPLRLLEIQFMDCSQAARLAVDGLSAVGIPARVLQMNGHVSAEFLADGKWRFAESEILTNGEFITDRGGEPASVDDILATPALLEGVHPYAEMTEPNEFERSRFGEVFQHAIYAQAPLATPYVIKKTAPAAVPRLHVLLWLNDRLAAEQMRTTSHHYGWNHYAFCDRAEPDCSN